VKIKRLLMATAIASLLSLGVAGPALADSDPIQASVPGTSTSSAANDAIVAKLQALEGTQTAEEIKSIITSGQPAEGLFDPVTGKWVAAYQETPKFSTQAISARGPGCATIDACATTSSNIPRGYYGTGQKDITVNNVKRVYAGNENTTWYYGNSGKFINQSPGVGANLTSNINVYGITRS